MNEIRLARFVLIISKHRARESRSRHAANHAPEGRNRGGAPIPRLDATCRKLSP
jgi:hypothetical protein